MGVHRDHDFITDLGITCDNSAACCGELWLPGATIFSSFNPASGQPIAQVGACSQRDYDTVIGQAAQRFQTWRRVPAPQRGELVRRIGVELRRHKDELGSLIALETGKIKQEGDGEVQEMIDIADFAVGQSRMLYGKTMHSERPHHRMYEQWLPIGVVGIITAFNFPAAVWAWNAFIAAVAGNVAVWKPSPKAPLTAIAVQHIVNRVMHDTGHRGVFSLFITEDTALLGLSSPIPALRSSLLPARARSARRSPRQSRGAWASVCSNAPATTR